MKSLSCPTWLAESLNQPDTTDILINGSRSIYIDQGEGLAAVTPETPWADEGIRSWVLDQLSLAGKTWDAKHPFVDATLVSGHRLHVVFPPLSKTGILISIRRLAQQIRKGSRWNDSSFYRKLVGYAQKGDCILISGATGSGKTTLVSDLIGEISVTERIIALEDTAELNPAHPHFISLISRAANADGYGEVTLRTLLKQALRMRPDRIVLGECRGEEVLDLLQALNTGHRGALATLHANSPRDALRRVELLCLLASRGTIPVSAIRELLAHGVQWIAQVIKKGGCRKITELWRVEGREGDTILMRPVIES